jgi:uncharacterized protein
VLTCELIQKELEKAGVLAGIQKDAAADAVKSANEAHTPQRNVVVAKGTPPLKGEPALVKYEFSTDDEKQTFRILPDGRIDYKGSANIPIAKKDQLLATVSAPAEGAPGINVQGKLIPADSGADTYLVAGSGVRASADGRSFFAEVSGCIILNLPVIEVLDLFEVKGDVDFSTGNIDFNGSVIIHGTVREGFEVKAAGDIIVQKMVEASRLSASRDVRVLGGIQGQGKGLIAAGRDVYAEFAQNARIEAQGSVYINDFAVNSFIFCKFLKEQRGHGSVVGGEVYAQRGIDVMILGSPAGTKTLVTSGSDYLVKRKMSELEKVETFCAENMKKIDQALKPVLALAKSNPEEIKGKTLLIQKTLQKRKALEEQLRIMSVKQAHLEKQLNVEGPCFVKVSRTCHTDVYITIKGIKTRVQQQRENVRFYEDAADAAIKTGVY